MDFVLTSDLDWTSEYCIEHFLEIAGQFRINPTLFVTHDSAIVRKAAAQSQVELGIHPNFLPDSTHGNSVESVIDHVLSIVPNPVAVRCHRYFDSPEIAARLAARGIDLDSNLCRHLERGVEPLLLSNGVQRLPVFFEDDVHWNLGFDWKFEEFRAQFFSEGLKILNFHPFFVALNICNQTFYMAHKSLLRGLTREAALTLRNRGRGAETFLVDAIEAILTAGHRFVTLGELAKSK